ncbi:MAG TPA: hypothetical protein VEB67_01350 [Nitrososphaerales archaeon]|nr:hypothetical protein [Nitrososphaerales archaeon]
MSSSIEQTVKALVDFESELDRVKADASDAKRKMLKDSGDWAASAREAAMSKAQDIASSRMSKAKEEAEEEAEAIKKKGDASMKAFETSISKNRAKAAGHVVKMLMGGNE